MSAEGLSYHVVRVCGRVGEDGGGARWTGYEFVCACVRVLEITITKTYLYNFDPLKPHFYIVKLGFTGVYIIFLISAQNIDFGCSLD